MNLLNYFTSKGFDSAEREGCVVVNIPRRNALEITPELEVTLQSNDGYSISLGRFADVETIWTLLNVLKGAADVREAC